MSDRISDRHGALKALSALADGEAGVPDVARACAAWKDQPEARAAWHSYHLIGDVMRSDDLAQANDSSAFLRNFRERLGQEAVVLAPGAAASQRPTAVRAPVAVVQPLRKRVWAGPLSVAAGFVMLVGVLLSSQGGPNGGSANPDASLAQLGHIGGQSAAGDLSLGLGNPSFGNAGFVPLPGTQQAAGVTVEGASFSRPETGDAVLMRDPRLDQALAAHRATQDGEASFASQDGLTRQVVFDGR